MKNEAEERAPINAYLASGWFDEEQEDTMNRVRDKILEFPQIKLFAPFYDGIVLTEENDSPEMREEVFSIDIGKVAYSDLVVVIVDDFEPGTIFEMGGAGLLCWLIRSGWEVCKIDRRGLIVQERLGHVPKILAYSDVSGRGLNVMLQQAVWGFANGIRQLDTQLRNFVLGEEPENYLEYVHGDFV